ncbi:hypothetical protein BT67DRAFT_390522 [Trichocladium antarcticum]|uniref:Uncharacterized protein n=1 Tax=Trichocladium antarcticum TaxID=1450529 RepID=A0AAN6UDE0_9PEZI|nr:hypothetical protein BT67DRAFT_390522 [Trichocladium antarcticum]
MEIPEGFSELPTKALGVIRAAKLAHPRGVLLESFITEAADRDRAAKHLLAQIAPQDNSHDVAAYLDAFCADWSKLVANFLHSGPGQPLRDQRNVPVITRRDGGVCRFSGLGDSWRDRLAVYPILPAFGARKIEIDPVDSLWSRRVSPSSSHCGLTNLIRSLPSPSMTFFLRF